MERPRVYLAGPEVFLPRERALAAAEAKKNICERHGLKGVFPFDISLDLTGLAPEVAATRISSKDENLMRGCDLVIANTTPFRSPSADVGTAFEMGFMRALGKPVFTYTNDPRCFKDRVAAQFPLTQEGRDSVDALGLRVEDHGLRDNLMLDGAALSSGGAAVAAAETVEDSKLFTDLTAFEACVVKAAALMASVAQAEDEGFMEHALEEARLAVKAGNHPFGAVLVADGTIVARAQNQVVTGRDPTLHAETALVVVAAKTLSEDVIKRGTLYTSTAPCPMCAGAIYWAGIPKVVYGCPAESLGEISGEELQVTCAQVFGSGKLRTVSVRGPVLGDKCAQMHREFWPSFLAGGGPM